MFNLCEYTCIKGRCLTWIFLTLFYFACHFILPSHNSKTFLFGYCRHWADGKYVALNLWHRLQWKLHCKLTFFQLSYYQAELHLETNVDIFFLIFESFKFFLCFFLNINYLIKVFSGICCWRFWCREWFLYF